jgi:predicted permease
LERVDAIPGVTTAGAIFGMPFTGFGYSISALSVDGRTLPHDEQEALSVQVRIVTPDFFRAMGIPIRRGRGIEATDRPGAPPVIVINAAAAKRIWQGEDPLGHTFVIGTRLGLGGDYAGGTVVGVIGDVKNGSLHETTAPTIYLSHAQFPTGFMGVAVRADGDPLALAKPVQAALAATDPNVPMFRVRSMEQLLDASVARPRLYASLLAIFSLVAVLLAAVGLYGVLAQSVAQRARELGIRLALGATAREVVRLVLTQASRLAMVGVVIGIGVALIVSRALAGLLYGVSPRDPVTLVAVAVLLFVVALVASWVPARRAGRVEPMGVLRDE